MKIYGFTYESTIVKSGLFSFNKKELEKKEMKLMKKKKQYILVKFMKLK